MIYAQLKTVPRWNHWSTSVLFVSLSIFGGALMTGQVKVAMFGLIFVGVVQIAAWLMSDDRFASRGSSMETATGLGNIGKVRMFEPPHTGTNYLLKEMVYVIGRKHAAKLRVISILLMVVIPVLMLWMGAHHDIKAVIAVASHVVGVFASRWLFFAEAEHVVGLYYGQR
jgi:DMSO reductase anchor subunit